MKNLSRRCRYFSAMAERELLKTAQFFQNYDAAPLSSGPGQSVYTEMNEGKVKSVSEFRKKHMKRRMALIKKLKNQKYVKPPKESK